ncbi:hypothetical protein BTVI_90037 [Pitangus sulphuratus]|nr:hypothetical protein BTVI_90037 [Pitangus sulphuratus]
MFLSHDFRRLGALLRSKDPIFHRFLEAAEGKLGTAVLYEELAGFSAARLASLHWKTSVVFVFPPGFDKLSDEIYRSQADLLPLQPFLWKHHHWFGKGMYPSTLQ